MRTDTGQVFPGRRRPAPNQGLFAQPLSLTASAGERAEPAVERFEALLVGDSMLLRVHLAVEIERSSAKLILDGGRGFDVIAPLPGPQGALGFVVHAGAVEDRTRFWLDVDGRIERLGEPELRVA